MFIHGKALECGRDLLGHSCTSATPCAALEEAAPDLQKLRRSMSTREERTNLAMADSSAEAVPICQRSDEEIKRFIEQHSLVWRFCMYGAIKNLQFFEAYLLLILLEWGYNLFQIGILQSITFSLTYAFEVPSGVIADHWGKKNELLLCFVFYIVSFVFYAFGESGFGTLVAASVFYGLGEAFRSGTHKVRQQ